MSAKGLIINAIRERGPVTVAEFMELALYHPQHGYYSGAARRSGRAGDFYTSVDVGPLFGETVAAQLADMWEPLRVTGLEEFHLVEAGAGDGRLARDILDTIAREHPDLYRRLQVTLVERSDAARHAQRETLASHLDRLRAPQHSLPARISGVILANELLDALPVHAVRMTGDGLREIYVAEQDGRLLEVDGPLSDAAIASHLAQVGASLHPGTRAEVGLAAAQWMREAAAALERGFLLLIDYGHETGELYSPRHAAGTLVAYHSHTVDAAEWLQMPGECDLTAHVDLTSVRLAAEAAGLTTLGAVDQTYFMLGLDVASRLDEGSDTPTLRRRLAARTLLMPGGLGSTMKVLAFGSNVGRPSLRGLSSGRVT